MLADWFLCSAFRLPPNLTHAYLDMLAALREPRERATLVIDAIDELRRVDTGLMLYALPRVTAAHRRLADVTAVTAQAAGFYDDLCAVLHTDGDRLRAAFAALPESPQALFVVLAEIADTCDAPDAARRPGDPYQDIVDYPAVTVTLALLIDVATRHADEVRGWIVDGAPTLLEHARSGGYGRLPLLFATHLVALVDHRAATIDELAKKLWEFGDRAADLEPDLVHALVQLRFPVGTDLRVLEAEAVNGNELNRWRAGTSPHDPIPARAAACARVGADGSRARDTAAVLWQATLWERIAALAPVEAIGLLRRWWQPPSPTFAEPVEVRVPCEPSYQATQAHLGALLATRSLQLRSRHPRIAVKPRTGAIGATSDEVAVLIGSPWLFRRSDKWGSRIPAQFTGSTQAAPLIRLCCAALLAVDLLRANRHVDPADEPTHLFALIFHLRDVTGDRSLRTALDNIKQSQSVKPTELPLPLQGLAYHAMEAIDRAGKGEYPELPGGRLARFILDGTGARERLDDAPDQWRLLFRQAARAIAVYWIKETSSGGLPRTTTAGDGWFDGVDPYARRLLAAVVGGAGAGFDANLSDAQRLLDEIYSHPRDADDSHPRDVDEWNWFRDRESHRRASLELHERPLNSNLLLLSPRYDIEVWTEYSAEIEPWLDGGGARQAMATVRLEALLADTESGDVGAYGEWVEKWLDLIEAINMPIELPRAIRFRMVGLLDAPVAAHGSQARVDAVGTAVIDAILDISRDAHRYYHLLFRALSRRLRAGDAIADSWRYRVMNLCHRLAILDPYRFGPRSPYDTTNRRRSSRDTEGELRSFLQATVLRTIATQAATLGDAIERLWTTNHHGPDATVTYSTSAEVEATAVWRDERTTRLIAVDHHHGQVVRHHHRFDPSKTHTSGEVRDLFLPQADRPQTLTQILRYNRAVFAIVCAVDKATGQMWFNCGLGYPLEYQSQPGARPQAVGSPVAIKLTGRTDEPKITEPIPLRRAQPVAGEVRRARVRSIRQFPGLRLEIDGERVDNSQGNSGFKGNSGEAERVRSRWDPDLGRAFTAPEGETWTTLAIWDETLEYWLPLDRTGLDLLAAESSKLAEGGRLRLTFVDHSLSDDGMGTDRVRFAGSPGRCYLLGESDFTQRSWAQLTERLIDAPTGLVVDVIATADGLLDLPADPFDDRNITWLSLFEDDSGLTIAHREANTWWIDVDTPDGYPDRIRVSKPHDSVTSPLFTLGRWGEFQARRGEIDAFPAEDNGITDPEDHSIERYERLHRLSKGEVVTLKNCAGNDLGRGVLRGFTAEGLSLSLKSESVTLYADPHSVHRFVRDRPVEIERDYSKPMDAERASVAATSDTILGMSSIEDARERDAVRERLTVADSITGMIVRTIRGPDNQVRAYGVWLRFDGDVVLVTVPETAFSVGGRHAGDHIAGSRSAEGWVFSVRYRVIRARGFYEQVDARATGWHLIGFATVGNRRKSVWQDPNRPIIAISDEQASWSGKTTIAKIGKGDGSIFDGKRYIRVAVRHGNVTMVGDAQEFERGADVRLDYPRIQLTRRVGAGTYFVARTFELKAAVAVRSARPEVGSEQRMERWREELERGRHHLTGELSDSELHLDIAALRPDGTWGNSLPLRPDEEPLIAARNAYKKLTRVRVEPEGQGYVGSFARAEPFTVIEFIEELKLSGDGSREHFGTRRVYYVGDETIGDRTVHRFEWGFGWVLDIPEEALRLGADPIDGAIPPFFHSDRVGAMRFTADPTVPGHVVVHIAPEDIHPSVEGQIMREAGKKVIHEIEVLIDVRDEMVTVLNIHTQSPESAGAAAGWIRTTDHSITGRMHRDSITALLNAERHSTGPVRRRILAKLDVDIARLGRLREFSWVPLTDLSAGQWLYMKAGYIRKTSNGTSLEFRLPDRLGAHTAFSVHVNRRRFSYSPGRLDQAFERHGKDAFHRRMMLVRLLPSNDKGWLGAVTNGPPRPFLTLLSWIRHNRGTCYATMGSEITVEVNPSVFYRVPSLRRRHLPEGTLVQLSQASDKREIVLTVALPAQEQYVRDGRLVVALPKDPLLRPNGITQAKRPRMFTVAGLPDLEATLDKGMDAKALLRTRHPRVLFAKSGSDGVVLYRSDHPGAGNAFAATIDIDGSDLSAKIRYLDGHTKPVAWARLSFANATATEIAERCRQNHWKYHDSRTGYWVDDDTVEPQPLRRDEICALTEPVMFASEAGPTLRYRSLDRFALPATELLDRTDDESADIHLVVAGSHDERGLWVELGPGRVVEIPASLFAQAGTPLARLEWSRFAVGDEITVRKIPDSPGYATLELRTWRPGVRAAFGKAPGTAAMLLPIQYILPDGGLLLGSGRETIKYPMDPPTTARYTVGAAVWLDRRNDVAFDAEREVAQHDIVLLGVDATTGDLRVHGIETARVVLTHVDKNTWSALGWLHDELEDVSARRALVNQLGGSLPVTVERVRRQEDGNLEIAVSRRHQPGGWWPSDRLARTEVAAALADHSLVLRAGGALRRVTADQAVPGSAVKAGAVSAALTTLTEPLWWTVGADGRPHTGLPEADTDERQVHIQHALGDDTECFGFICRDPRSQAMGLLSTHRASWAEHKNAAAFMTVFGTTDPITVTRLPHGGFSVIDRPLVAREFDLLALGSALQVRISAALAEADHSGRFPYLARTRLTDVLLTVYSDTELTVGDHLSIEISGKSTATTPTATGEPIGTRKTVLDVPAAVATGLRALSQRKSNSKRPVQTLDRMTAQFATLESAYREGLLHGDASRPLEEQIVRAAGVAIDDPHDPRLGGILLAWLRDGGDQVVAGRGECELLPLLTACIVTAAVGDAHADIAGLSVLMAHQLGRRAARSIHIEPLVSEWLTRRDRHDADGPWRRMAQLKLGDRLDMSDSSWMARFCEAVMARPVVHGAADDRVPVARALLASIGRLEATDQLEMSAPTLAPLAALSRALSPPDGLHTAQRELLPAQTEILRFALRTHIAHTMALPLLPPVGRLPDSGRRLIRSAIAQLERDVE
ncbi:hypothetical protein [Nocardia bovistercoris]|uniref:Uncharacterized protein n=1 Tax=Nocardia bovistercoris TaxID=2785916 RepID=A0A931N0H6_9NOCA|nr:hypothetical protein [Nocardia bovistercoris]MBH0775009.1 hypothetical protein [Nocardia bovistercoris]